MTPRGLWDRDANDARRLQKLAEDLKALQAATDEKYNQLAASLAVQQERQARVRAHTDTHAAHVC